MWLLTFRLGFILFLTLAKYLSYKSSRLISPDFIFWNWNFVLDTKSGTPSSVNYHFGVTLHLLIITELNGGIEGI